MGRLKVRHRYDSPVRETSGVCVTTVAGQELLVVVGDRDPTVAWCRLDPDPADWHTLDLAALPGAPSDLGQCESVEDAGGGTVLVMAEEPSLVLLVDVPGARILGQWRVEPGGDRSFERMWDRDPNSRGEALVVGSDGHILVVKEKCPVVAAELGPPGAAPSGTAGRDSTSPWRGSAGEELVPLQWAEIVDAPSDVSDAAVLSGTLVLLSDQDRSLSACARVGDAWGVTDTFPLDKAIEKPEGLTLTADGRLLVAMDLRSGAGAIAEIDPPGDLVG